MEYLIYRKNIPSQFINLELTLQCTQDETLLLQLPSWRPGRYELANYAQKIRGVKAFHKGKEIKINKSTKDLWQFVAPDTGSYLIHYEFHASQMDAGGSWSDDEQLYLNFINFIFEIKGREEEKIQVRMDLPDNYAIATALPVFGSFVWEADNFQHLVDSPLIASANLQHHSYEIEGCNFHLWFQGAVHFNVYQLLTHFTNITRKQIDAFGEFPAQDYHFLFQLLPYKHYHGVEHRFSTVITLGPADELDTKAALDPLIGVSSHELYHFWNVCRIRPKELHPYDFSKEAYIDTGVVAEGVTTYMGDLFLLKSGYFSLDEYLAKLEKLINREFDHFGWQNQSIAESSFDLWLDGYKPGIPDKKVSIYNRGALISLCLDLVLLDHGSSLSAVMKNMWINFGKKEIGYSLADYLLIIGQALKDQNVAEQFFEQFIYGKENLLPTLKIQLESLGITVKENKRKDLESDFGLILDQTSTLTAIHPESPAYEKLMIGDVVTRRKKTQNQEKESISLTIRRGKRLLEFDLPHTAKTFYRNYSLQLQNPTDKLKQWKE